MDATVSGTNTILCVAGSAQRGEIEAELVGLAAPGVSFVFEPSPAKALDLVDALKPSLVLVGTDLGWLGGFEFVSDLKRRFSELDFEVLVVPRSGASGVTPILFTARALANDTAGVCVSRHAMATYVSSVPPRSGNALALDLELPRTIPPKSG